MPYRHVHPKASLRSLYEPYRMYYKHDSIFWPNHWCHSGRYHLSVHQPEIIADICHYDTDPAAVRWFISGTEDFRRPDRDQTSLGNIRYHCGRRLLRLRRNVPGSAHGGCDNVSAQSFC